MLLVLMSDVKLSRINSKCEIDRYISIYLRFVGISIYCITKCLFHLFIIDPSTTVCSISSSLSYSIPITFIPFPFRSITSQFVFIRDSLPPTTLQVPQAHLQVQAIRNTWETCKIYSKSSSTLTHTVKPYEGASLRGHILGWLHTSPPPPSFPSKFS